MGQESNEIKEAFPVEIRNMHFHSPQLYIHKQGVRGPQNPEVELALQPVVNADCKQLYRVNSYSKAPSILIQNKE